MGPSQNDKSVSGRLFPIAERWASVARSRGDQVRSSNRRKPGCLRVALQHPYNNLFSSIAAMTC